METEATSDQGRTDPAGADASSAVDEVPESGDPHVGRLLKDRYEIVERIGEGGMGKVYAARQQPLGREVAVKLVDAENTDESGDTYFMREIEVINRLRHPNIVNFVDYGTDDDLLYLVMEYLPGKTLRQVIGQEYPIDQLRICKIGIQVLSALEQAHDQGVVHCDLKPANIMLEEVTGQSDFVKLLDFGVAKVGGPAAEPGPHTREGDIIGTFDYMSPEQIMQEELDGRADVWSIGVILFEMLTQKRLFRAEDAVATVGRVVRADIPSPSDFVEGIVPKLETVIAAALTRRVADRPDAATLRDELVQIRDGLQAQSGAADLLRQRHTDDAEGHGLIEQSDAALTDQFPEVSRLEREAEAVVPAEAHRAVETQLERVGDGRGSGLVVTGPAGCGKSWFLDQTLDRLRTEGWQVFRASSDGAENVPALGFARSWIRELLPRAVRDDEELADILDKLGLEQTDEPIVAFLTGQPGKWERGDRTWPGDDEFATFLAALTHQLVRGALRYGPVCLAVDDFPSDSDQARRLVEVLSAAVADYPVFFLGTAEQGLEADGDLAAVIDEVGLDPFDHEDIDGFLRENFGIKFSREVIDKIRTETGGNPRAIDELLMGLQGKSVSQPTTSAKISARLSLERRERIDSQVERLSDERAEWLKRLSVWGESIAEAVVDRLREADFLPKSDWTPSGEEGQFLRRTRDVFDRDVLRFRSSAIREALYASVPAKELRTWHRLAADMANDGEFSGELFGFERLEALGRHRLLAGDPVGGGREMWKAGQMRRQRFDRPGAISTWSTAVEQLRASDEEPDLADVAAYSYASLIPTLREEGRASEAVDVAYEFVGFGGLSRRMRTIAAAELGRSLVAVGEYDEAERRLKRLWGDISDGERPFLQIRTLLGLGEVYDALDELDRRSMLLRKAVRRAAQVSAADRHPVDPPSMLWLAHNRLGLQHLADDDPAETLRLFKAGREIAEAVEEPGGSIRLTSNVGAAYMYDGDGAEAGRWFERALELASHHGDCARRVRILNNLGIALVEHGARNAARERFERARNRAGELGWSELEREIGDRLARLDDRD